MKSKVRIELYPCIYTEKVLGGMFPRTFSFKIINIDLLFT